MKLLKVLRVDVRKISKLPPHQHEHVNSPGLKITKSALDDKACLHTVRLIIGGFVWNENIYV